MVAVAKQRVEKESDEISAGQAALRYEVMLGTKDHKPIDKASG